MAQDTFFKGENQILYLVVGGLDYPIACLTENSFTEDVEMLETTTADNGGWKTSRPLNQGYGISFSGIAIASDKATIEKYSLDLLRGLKRARTKITWKISTGALMTETGEGYIVGLSESAPAEGLITFSGGIIGYGTPTTLTTDYLFESSEEFLFEDGTEFLFNI